LRDWHLLNESPSLEYKGVILDKLVETRIERFWYVEAWRRDQWVKAQASKLPAGSRVLDAGAGASKYRPFFSHCQYETQDFCQYSGPLVKYLQPIDHVCEITEIPLPDASMDAILCTEVIEHVVDPMAVLAEFRRLLKPGGRLLLTAPQSSFVHMEPYHYYSGFTKFWYEHWLPRHGFSLESLTPHGGPGRFAVYSLHALYDSWKDWERQNRGLKSAFSIPLRMLAKLPVHYLLPWLLPKFDRAFGHGRVACGILVVGVRQGS
jgi:SAM-dependent methyltransferase